MVAHAADTRDHQKHRGGAAQGQSGTEARCQGVVYTPTLPSPSIP